MPHLKVKTTTTTKTFPLIQPHKYNSYIFRHMSSEISLLIMEDGHDLAKANQRDQSLSRALRLTLLFLNCTLMVLGTGGPLLLRVYFLHGGKRMWLSSFIQVGGWPVLLIPLSISCLHRYRRRRQDGNSEFSYFHMTLHLVAACGVIGTLAGLGCYLFTFSSAYLPVSTSCLLSSTQIAFVAFFAFLIVKQRFTPFSVNSVVLLTLGAVILGVSNTGDHPIGVSRFCYFLGFLMTIAAACLYGLMLPLVELVYIKSKKKITYSFVMEMQIIISIFATVVCVCGMIVSNDFKLITKEAKEYGLGERKYYILMISGGVFWQMYNLGLTGTISCSSSLFAGVVGAALLPVAEVIAVVFFHERFDGGKGVSLALSLWGFFSYWYGELQQNRELVGE